MADVIIAGWMDYAIHRDEVLSHLRAVSRASLDEAGCLDYAMSADALDPGRIRVFERWASQEALDAHLASPHVRDLRAAIAVFPRVDRSLHRFVVSRAGSL